MKKIILLILFLKSFAFCSAQLDSLQERNEWKIFGAAGIGTGITNHELNFPLKLFIQKGEHTLFSRVQSCFDTGIGAKSPDIDLTEYAIMYAYNTSPYSDVGNVYFSFGAGIGYVKGIARGSFIENQKGMFKLPFEDYEKYEELRVSKFGLALECNFIKPSSNYFGVGGSIYANVNSLYPIFGCNLILYFGNL